VKFYGGASDQEGNGIIQMSDSGYVVVGSSEIGLQDDIYVVRTDAGGNEIWRVRHGNSDLNEVAHTIHETLDGGLIISGFAISSLGDKEAFAMKLDDMGAIIWEKTHGFEGTDEIIYDLQVTSDSGFALIGQTTNVEPKSNHDYNPLLDFHDMYMIKLDKDGNLVWEEIFGFAGDDFGASLFQRSDESYVILGTTSLSEAGQSRSNIILMETTSRGGIMDAKFYGDTDGEVATTLSTTADGGFLLTAQVTDSAENRSVILMRLDQAGEVLWQNTLITNADGGGIANSVKEISDGSIVVAGGIDGDSTSGFKIFLRKLSADGSQVWQQTHGQTVGRSICSEVIETKEGGFALTGGAFTFEFNSRTMFIIKTDSNGAIIF